MLNLIYFPNDFKLEEYMDSEENIQYTMENEVIENKINLIYGYSNIKRIDSEFEVDFLDTSNKIRDNLFWVYSIEEHDEKFGYFMQIFLLYLSEKYLDLFQIKHIEIDNMILLNYLNFEKVFVNKNYIFYGLVNKTIYIVNLNLLHYFTEQINFIVKDYINKIKNKIPFIHDIDGVIYEKYFNKYDSIHSDKLILLLQ